MKKGFMAAAALLVFFVLAGTAMASLTYTTLLPPGWTSSQAQAINTTGNVLGDGNDELGQASVFLYSSGGYTKLSQPGWNEAYAADINSTGKVIGDSYDASWKVRVFLYDGSRYTLLIPDGWTDSYAAGLNDVGDVAGYGLDGSGQTRGFLYKGGAYATIMPADWNDSYVWAINDNGQAVGDGHDASGNWRGFLYNPPPAATPYTVLLPDGWTEGEAYASDINNNGKVAGYGLDGSGQWRGFIYDDGTYTLLLPPGWTDAYASGIDDNGRVVGYGVDSSEHWRGFVYDNGVYTVILPPGWTEAYASDLNSNGQVTGYGIDSSGQYRGFLATLGASSSTPLLTLIKSGTGEGTVSSSPSGIDCGDVCSAAFTSGSTVTLTGHAESDSYFTGWSYPCSGNGTCTVTLASDTQVIATFNPVGDPFIDVPPGHWAEAYIIAIWEAGITTGWGGGNEFKPDYNVTREQMAAFIERAVEGEPDPGYCGSGIPFTDVPAASWACPYIKKLSEAGITAGYGGTDEYKPGFDVTREQMAAFIVRAVEGEPAEGYCGSTAPFPDVPVTSWACGYIKRLAELEITTGYGGTGLYRPELPVTRAQMAAFIARAFLGME